MLHNNVALCLSVALNTSPLTHRGTVLHTAIKPVTFIKELWSVHKQERGERHPLERNEEACQSQGVGYVPMTPAHTLSLWIWNISPEQASVCVCLA